MSAARRSPCKGPALPSAHSPCLEGAKLVRGPVAQHQHLGVGREEPRVAQRLLELRVEVAVGVGWVLSGATLSVHSSVMLKGRCFAQGRPREEGPESSHCVWP